MAIPQACKMVSNQGVLAGNRVLPVSARLGQIDTEIIALEARILTLREGRDKVTAEMERKS
ncbi:MAG TPA: hypothetical protein VN857_06175 [Chthoniobacterales bacterium]|nr:hypothetical protein [Chthoniobacterales bacterium]